MYIEIDMNMIEPIEELLLKPKSTKNKTQKRKRCPKGKRKNPVTARCRLKCKPGSKRFKRKSRCLKDCKSGYSRSRKTLKCVKN